MQIWLYKSILYTHTMLLECKVNKPVPITMLATTAYCRDMHYFLRLCPIVFHSFPWYTFKDIFNSELE